MPKFAFNWQQDTREKEIMPLFTVLSHALLVFLSLATMTRTDCEACLPKGVKDTDVISTQVIRSAKGNVIKKITVKQKLLELKARCKEGKLVDATGREIYFYKLKGCWGFPPRDYLEIMQRQQDELEKLKKRYTVIEMTCNPSGTPIA